MSNRTEDRPVALVTGASSGFGLLASVALAKRGHRVFASMRDLGKRTRLEAAAAEAGVTVEVVRLDVTDEGSIARAVAEVEGAAGQIDVLVNNAGFGLGGFLEDLSLDELREQFETNFFGAAAMMKAVIPGMRVRRRGRIINVSSIAGRVGNPGVSAYSASKFALEGLSESARHELLPFDVYVVLVEPGSFKTDIFTSNRRMGARALDPASPYHGIMKNLDAFMTKLVEGAGDPRHVADVIVKAATTSRPALRYLVGKDARGEAIAKTFLPFRLFEAGVQTYIKWKIVRD